MLTLWCTRFAGPADENIFRPCPRRGYPLQLQCARRQVQDLNGQLHLEQHLELDEHLSMKQAHDEVTRLETEMRAEIPKLRPS